MNELDTQLSEAKSRLGKLRNIYHEADQASIRLKQELEAAKAAEVREAELAFIEERKPSPGPAKTAADLKRKADDAEKYLELSRGAFERQRNNVEDIEAQIEFHRNAELREALQKVLPGFNDALDRFVKEALNLDGVLTSFRCIDHAAAAFPLDPNQVANCEVRQFKNSLLAAALRFRMIQGHYEVPLSLK